MEGVWQRRANLAEQLELADRERGLSALRLRRDAADADHVAEIEIDAPQIFRPDQELDPAAPVDEVEEHQLPQVAARENASRHAVPGVSLRSGLEIRRFGPDHCDLFPVRKAFGEGRRHRREPRATP